MNGIPPGVECHESLLAGNRREMEQPVEVGLRNGLRRKTHRDPCQC